MFENFDRDFNRTRRRMRMMSTIIVIFILLVFGFYATSFSKAASGRHMYQITVYNYGSEETYFTDSIISKDNTHIVFMNTFGMKQDVMGSGISVTQFK